MFSYFYRFSIWTFLYLYSNWYYGLFILFILMFFHRILVRAFFKRGAVYIPTLKYILINIVYYIDNGFSFQKTKQILRSKIKEGDRNSAPFETNRPYALCGMIINNGRVVATG